MTPAPCLCVLFSVPSYMQRLDKHVLVVGTRCVTISLSRDLFWHGRVQRGCKRVNPSFVLFFSLSFCPSLHICLFSQRAQATLWHQVPRRDDPYNQESCFGSAWYFFFCILSVQSLRPLTIFRFMDECGNREQVSWRFLNACLGSLYNAEPLLLSDREKIVSQHTQQLISFQALSWKPASWLNHTLWCLARRFESLDAEFLFPLLGCGFWVFHNSPPTRKSWGFNPHPTPSPGPVAVHFFPATRYSTVALEAT